MAAQEEERRAGGSGAVNRAREYLESVTGANAPTHPGAYERQIAGLYDRIVNRTAFRYDEAKAPLQASLDERAFQRYLRQVSGAERDGGEENPWRI